MMCFLDIYLAVKRPILRNKLLTFNILTHEWSVRECVIVYQSSNRQSNLTKQNILFILTRNKRGDNVFYEEM